MLLKDGDLTTEVDPYALYETAIKEVLRELDKSDHPGDREDYNLSNEEWQRVIAATINKSLAEYHRNLMKLIKKNRL